MKKKTMLVIGILLVVGAISVAMAQNSETKDAENHECTPEMMENMPENCPEQMMQSEACENMMNANGCEEMMDNKPAEDTEAGEPEHCGDMDSMMDSSAVTRKAAF